MNSLSKILVFVFALTFCWNNVECMHNSRPFNYANGQTLPDGTQQPTSNKAVNVGVLSTWNLAGYLTQLGSIYSIDTTNSKVIDSLAVARTFFNASRINSIVDDFCNGRLRSNFLAVYALLSLFARGYNVSKDYKIWDNASSIGTSNAVRKGDMKLKNKKVCHYAWSTFNLVLPRVLRLMTQTNHSKMVVWSYVFANLSELYRQHLLYQLIANTKK